MGVIAFLDIPAPYIGAGIGFYYGYSKFKKVRNNMQNNPRLAKGLTLVLPSTVGFIIPKTLHYILTSNAVRIAIVVSIGCCVVGAVERKNNECGEDN